MCEITASAALQRLGATSIRTLSFIETGEDLWSGDELSLPCSSVMLGMARTYLRLGTCERLLNLRQPDKLESLLRHVWPTISRKWIRDSRCEITELVDRMARLTAEWMAGGFNHGVLNTDNISLAVESFDYDPFAVLDQWDPRSMAAYVDRRGLYAYGQQPAITHHNQRLLQESLGDAAAAGRAGGAA